jgi:putative endonuclease
MNQKKSTVIGRLGERAARQFLAANGYEILEVNWRFKKLEVDIIAKKQDTLVFIEVKTRKSNTFGEPELFVTRKKQRFLVAAANQYVTERDLAFESRFDVVSVISPDKNQTIKHLEGAFFPLLK